jgi:hypothetical protein
VCVDLRVARGAQRTDVYVAQYAPLHPPTDLLYAAGATIMSAVLHMGFASIMLRFGDIFVGLSEGLALVEGAGVGGGGGGGGGGSSAVGGGVQTWPPVKA